VQTYNGEIAQGDLDSMLVRFPAVFVYVAGMENEPRGNADVRTFEIVLHVITESLRENDVKTVYQVLEEIRKLLHRKPLFENAEPLYVVSERILDTSPSGIVPARAVYRFRTREIFKIS